MGRWEPNARGRLEQAALALYAERGFENTTVAEIAQRAGLTERTFFRHFADKREVLFSGAQSLQELFVHAIEQGPDNAAGIELMATALRAVATVFEGRREFARQRQAIVTATPELQERELVKLATLAAALTDALRGRGIADPAATLTAQAGVAVFRIAFERWVFDREGPELWPLMREALDALAGVVAERQPVA